MLLVFQVRCCREASTVTQTSEGHCPPDLGRPRLVQTIAPVRLIGGRQRDRFGARRMSDFDRDDFGNAALSGRPSVSPEQPVPEKIDHREIAVRVAVVNEMQLLLAPEPCISPKA